MFILARGIIKTSLLLVFLLLPNLALAEQARPHTLLPTPGETFTTDRQSELVRTAHATDGLRDGWPVHLNTPGSGFPYTPTLFDMDGDGADEIFLTGGHTFGLAGDGSFLPGWPTTEHLYMGYGTNGSKPGPSVDRLTPGGDPAVLWSQRDWWAGSSIMWSFNGMWLDGSDLPNFPQEAPDTPSNALDTPFVLGDANDDGNLEAWGVHSYGNAFLHYRLTAFDHLGNRIFTRDLNPAENVLSLYYGDIDGDTDDEFFAVSWLSPSYLLHVFEADGGSAPGYPSTLFTLASGYLMFGPPIPADLDGDGDLEILLGYNNGGSSYAHCLHHDSNPCVGYPLQIAGSSQLFYLGLGDLTGDGDPELLAFDNHLGGNYRAFAIDRSSGMALPNWPVSVATWPKSFPTVVDIDNDALQDMCFVTDGGTLEAYSGAGTSISGYPKTMANASISGVAAGDIDGDGLFELVAATWDGWVYAWETEGVVLPGRMDWPLRGVDTRNTGVFRGAGDLTAAADFPFDESIGLRLVRNPVGERAEFVLSVPRGAGHLTIHDPRGRRIADLGSVAGERFTWRPGPDLPAGLYLARLRMNEETAIAKFLILR